MEWLDPIYHSNDNQNIIVHMHIPQLVGEGRESGYNTSKHSMSTVSKHQNIFLKHKLESWVTTQVNTLDEYSV